MRSKLSPEIAKKIITARAERKSIEQCAYAGGVSVGTLRNWISSKPRKGHTVKPPIEQAFLSSWLAAEKGSLRMLAYELRSIYPAVAMYDSAELEALG